MTELYELLDVVGKLNEEFKSKKDFNVFDAIRFRSQEVMHSKFIATLLDPKGQHKMGIKFLEKFLERIKYSGFDTNNVTVWSERQAKIERLARTRWIDITVENKNTILIIENKIWAEDQPQQLEDYYNFCDKQEKWENVKVIYLTPYGHYPSTESLGETLKREDIKLISYEKHIIPWIYECSRDKEVKERLKYSLEMYHEILQTVINRSHYMNEIFEELKNKSKLKLAIDIISALTGRDYIKEFPETIDILKTRICSVLGDVNPHPDENDTILNVDEDGKEFSDWRFYLCDGDEFYISNGNQEQDITLFHKSDLTDAKLRSLIFGETDIIDEWLKELFEDIKKIK